MANTRTRKLALVAAGVVILVGLFVALRGRDDDESGAGPTTVTGTTTQGTTTVVDGEPPPVKPGPLTIKIVFRKAKPAGPRTLKVKKGRDVVLVVSADVVDEVHLHGYDIARPVAPGKPARIAFRATLPGVFEIELEERRVLLAEVEVRP